VPLADPIAAQSAKYWDENREKARDPGFWMAHPLCREAINRRVTGSPDEWPLDWFRRVHARQPFSRGVSFGCGLGAFERSAIRCGLALEIDAFDISPRSLEEARETARREGLRCIAYRIGDFDDPRLLRERYDIAFFHASLHHVSELERLFRRLTFTLKPGGAIYLDEFIGPSRNRWGASDLAFAQELLDLLPPEAKRQQRLAPPVEQDDPSEAVRSGEIPAFFDLFFERIAWRPYGGQLVDLLFPCFRPEWLDSAIGGQALAALLAIEDREITRDSSQSHHVVAYGRLKPGSGRWRLVRSAVGRFAGVPRHPRAEGGHSGAISDPI
jgi:SAM-dependent methyltransferase